MPERRSKAILQQLKELAKMYYIKDSLTQKEIAAKTGISEKTIGKWVVEGKWEKQKKNFILTRQEQMALMLDELEEINNSIKSKAPGQRFADSKLGDVRRKLVRDIKELETKTSKPEAVGACIALLNFIRNVDLAIAQQLSPWIDGFIKSLY